MSETEVPEGGGCDGAGLTPAQRRWLSHIRRCQAEGLTYKAYCEREGLEVGGLYAARRRMRRRQSPLVAVTSPPRFAAVRLAQPAPVGSAHVMLPNGVQLAVSISDIDDLVRLAQSLGRLPG